LLPLPWLLIAAIKLWQAVHTEEIVLYIEAFGFFGVAFLFYISQRYMHFKRQPPII